MLGYFIDIRVGHVICRQLGYSVAQQVFRKSVFGHVNGPLLIEQTRCNGNESDISQCTVITIDHKSSWYYFNVRDRAGVRCAEPQVESSKGWYSNEVDDVDNEFYDFECDPIDNVSTVHCLISSYERRKQP